MTTALWTTALLDDADHLLYADIGDDRFADGVAAIGERLSEDPAPFLYRFDDDEIVLDHFTDGNTEPGFSVMLPAICVAGVDPTDHRTMVRTIHDVAVHALNIPQLPSGATFEARDAGARLMDDILRLTEMRVQGFNRMSPLRPPKMHLASPFGPARIIMGKDRFDLPSAICEAYGLRPAWVLESAPTAHTSMRIGRLSTYPRYTDASGIDALRAAAAPGMTDVIDAFAPFVGGVVDGIAFEIVDTIMDLARKDGRI